MPESPTSAPPMPESLVFAAHHQPTLKEGNYEIKVEHRFEDKREDETDPVLPSQTYKTYTATRRFRVEGERFQLKPDDIQAVFPPKGSLGDHSNVLPHIVLTHSTLPWERLPWECSLDGNGDPLPWLLLLVFSEAEKPETQVITLGDLANQGPKFPSLSLNNHQKPDDPVSIIDVPRQVLEPLLPTLDDMAMLAHVRRLHFGEGAKSSMSRQDLHDSERAVIIANRLPEPGATSTVHLVSVEGRYDTASRQFNFKDAGPEDRIRLVSLTSWRFACISSEHTFACMIQGLERDHRSFRLPDSSNVDADGFLREGFVPVRHALRQGGKTLSWYRGPFVNGAVEAEIGIAPVHTSDALLRYHPDVGMFDVSYASAWELGRLMALQSQTFSTSLYEWKRLRDQQDKCSKRLEQRAHPLVTVDTDTTLAEPLKVWLEQLSYLQGVPFKYLVPDERLLPKESIRFFQIDTNWIRCLLDGAYSIGRITKSDCECDRAMPLSIPYSHATGVLIRSDIVSGYPGLLIDAYDQRNDSLTELRRQNLSPNILLSIFEGDLARLDIHQKPETLHFALEENKEGGYKKELSRSLKNDQMQENQPNHTVNVSLTAQRIVCISQLVACIQNAFNMSEDNFNSGHFALQMIESSEKVSFYRG